VEAQVAHLPCQEDRQEEAASLVTQAVLEVQSCQACQAAQAAQAAQAVQACLAMWGSLEEASCLAMEVSCLPMHLQLLEGCLTVHLEPPEVGASEQMRLQCQGGRELSQPAEARLHALSSLAEVASSASPSLASSDGPEL